MIKFAEENLREKRIKKIRLYLYFQMWMESIIEENVLNYFKKLTNY